MTQNLDWNGGGIATAPADWGNDDDKARYYDPGDYVYTTPTTVNNCGSVANLSDCTSKGWKAYASGDDEHYLIGNYYSWAAATARTGEYLWEDGTEAPGSICPKNWKLPLSGDSAGSNNGKSGSFRNLLSKYGFSFNDNGVSESLEGIVGGTRYNIAGSPLYFLRGGYVNTASLDVAGIASVYWSRTASSGTTTYYLAFYSADVYPSYSNSRFYGLSIRCVVM